MCNDETNRDPQCFCLLFVSSSFQMPPRDQHKLIHLDCARLLFLCRYANLVDDLAVLAKFAGSDISLPNRKHKSYSQRCPNTGLSRKTQDLILELYANDFDR